MDRGNPYEAAFEAYLRDARIGYVAVDESRRTSLDDEPVKSLDFIVHAQKARLLVDIKGRKYPSGSEKNPRFVWESWTPREDVDGLLRWEEQFGLGYRSLLVFVYQLLPFIDLPLGTPDIWFWRGRRYLIRGVTVEDYSRHMRLRSPKWDTVDLPTASFREIVEPFKSFLRPAK